jgi:hypothetical protein
MSSEAASRLDIERTPSMYAYETIETPDTIAATMQHLCATRVDQVALVTIALFFESDAKTSSNHAKYIDPLASTHYFLNSLRPLVRRTDAVFLFGNTLHFLLPGANLQGGEIVQSRLWEALLWRIHNTTAREITRPVEITIGHSAYPAPYQTIGECIVAAKEAKLRSNFASERSTRKTVVRQAREVQQQAADDELPALARKLGVPYLSLLPKKLPARVQQLINARLAQELHCYPVGRERNILTVAMENPQDHAVLERLQQVTGLIIFPVLTHPEALQTALEQLI